MIYDYIIDNFELGEPILIEEIPGNSRSYVSQEMRKLVDAGQIEKVRNGVYYLAYATILGTQGKMSVDKYIKKRYLFAGGSVNGYVTGLQLANNYGFTTQNPACYEVCSNTATTKQRKEEIYGQKIIIYKPVATVTDESRPALQFLDLMRNIDRYSEYDGDELTEKLKSFIATIGLNLADIKKYLPLYPDRVYRNIYEGGLMGELVR